MPDFTSTRARRRAEALRDLNHLDAEARRYGFRDSGAMESALQLVAHLDRGGALGKEHIEQAKQVWPSVPESRLRELAAAINRLEPDKRGDRLVMEVTGPAGFAALRDVSRTYGIVDIAETLTERAAAGAARQPAVPVERHEDAEQEQARLAQERRDAADLRETIASQVNGLERLLRTPAFAPAHAEALGRVMQRAAETLAKGNARNPDERPSLYETVEAATRYHEAEAEAVDQGYLPSADEADDGAKIVPPWAMSESMREEAVSLLPPELGESVREAFGR